MTKGVIRKLLAILLSTMLAYGCAAPAVPEAQSSAAPEETAQTDPYVQRAEELLARMDARSKVEQLLLVNCYTYNGEPMVTLNEELRSYFENHNFGGFILFDQNCQSASQVVNLTHDLQNAALANEGTPMFIAIDQEGGYVARLAFGTRTPGNMALGASGEPSLSKAAAGIIGSEMKALGFNLDFAPVLDVNSNPANPVIGIRSFSDDPMLVSKLGTAYVQGLNDQSIAAAVKHYPGHGDTDTDSHTGLPVESQTKEELEQGAFIPFHEAVSAGCDMVMTAHICFPNIESDTYTSILDGEPITFPATLSDDLIQHILRDEMGYEGVVVTDSLQMEAIRSHFDPIDAAVYALNAGADLLMMPVIIENSDGFAALDQYVDAVLARIPDTVSQERIDEAVTRILTLKARRGILGGDYSLDAEAMAEKAESLVGEIANHESERAIAAQTVTVLKNENDILPMDGAGTILFAAPQQIETDALRFGYEQLMGEINLAYFSDYINYSYGSNIQEVLGKIPDSAGVVIVSWLDNMSQFDPNESIMIPSVQSVIDACHSAGKPCIVISAGLPYDLSCYENADALLAVYNPYGVTYDESGRPLPGYAPNIPAALDIIFGRSNPSGRLPVNVPAVEGTALSDTIAYPRGSGLTW